MTNKGKSEAHFLSPPSHTPSHAFHFSFQSFILSFISHLKATPIFLQYLIYGSIFAIYCFELLSPNWCLVPFTSRSKSCSNLDASLFAFLLSPLVLLSFTLLVLNVLVHICSAFSISVLIWNERAHSHNRITFLKVKKKSLKTLKTLQFQCCHQLVSVNCKLILGIWVKVT